MQQSYQNLHSCAIETGVLPVGLVPLLLGIKFE